MDRPPYAIPQEWHVSINPNHNGEIDVQEWNQWMREVIETTCGITRDTNVPIQKVEK